MKNKMIEKLKRLISAPTTAFDNEGQVNVKIVSQYAQFLNKNGITGVFVNGSTGEGFSLDNEERMKLASVWVDAAPPDFKIIINCGHTSLNDAKMLAKHAQDIGADGFGTIGPLYFKPKSPSILVDHCAKEAAAAPELPYYYYHIPAMSGVNLPMIEFLKIGESRIPNLQGIKFSNPWDLMDFSLCVDFQDQKYDVVYGQDQTLLSALVIGAKAAIGSTYNFLAPIFNKIIDAYDKKELEKARKLQVRVNKFLSVIFKHGKFFSACKEILNMLGLNLGPVRSPLQNLTKNEVKSLKEDLQAEGFFLHTCII